MITIKKILRMFIIIALVASPVFCSVRFCDAAEVETVRVNSETDKTRVVVQFDEPAQYQVQYTSEPGISVCLLMTGLGSARKMTSVSDGLVKIVTLKEIMAHDNVDLDILNTSATIFTDMPLFTASTIDLL